MLAKIWAWVKARFTVADSDVTSALAALEAKYKADVAAVKSSAAVKATSTDVATAQRVFTAAVAAYKASISATGPTGATGVAG